MSGGRTLTPVAPCHGGPFDSGGINPTGVGTPGTRRPGSLGIDKRKRTPPVGGALFQFDKPVKVYQYAETAAAIRTSAISGTRMPPADEEVSSTMTTGSTGAGATLPAKAEVAASESAAARAIFFMVCYPSKIRHR